MFACMYVSMLILQAVVVNAQGPATLSVTHVIQGATATFECSFPSLTSPATLDIYKDSVALYQCANIALTCSKASTDNDYSDVTFTALGTASAKGTFTVENADQTRDGGDWKCEYGTSLISSPVTFVVSAQSAALLSVENVLQGATATFECSYPSLTSPTPLDIYKDNAAVYMCTDIALTCSKSSTDNDYSDVTFTGLGTASATGTFTLANADQTRDGGEWTCKYGTSLISPPVIFVVTGASTTQTATPRTVSSTLSSTVSSSSSSASSSTATVHSTQESETTTTNRTTTSARDTNPTTTSERNTNPTTTSARNTTYETNTEWELVYFIVPTMITLTVVIIVITFVSSRTRQIKRSRHQTGMEQYSLSRRGIHNVNCAYEPPASYSMSMEHSNPCYVSRAHMLNENTGSSGTNMTHDQIFFDDTSTTKELLEGIEGLHFSARYIRNWSDLNDSSVNLFK